MFIAVDGGASKTLLAAYDDAGTEVARASVGPASLTVAGVAGAWGLIEEGVGQLGHGLKPEDLRVGMGLAGVNNGALRGAFLDQAPGYASLAVASDGYTSVLGAHGGAPGSVVALGTGSVGYRLDDNMAGRQVAGWGFPVDDAGGGSWLGLHILQECVQVLDGRLTRRSDLHDAVIAHCGGPDGLINWMLDAAATRYATLAPMVLAAAVAGDDAGVRLARTAGEDAAAIATALDPARAAPLSLLGGLAAPLTPFLPDWLTAWARPALGDGVAGALLMAQGRAPAERFAGRG